MITLGPLGRAVRLPLQRAWWALLRKVYPPAQIRKGPLQLTVMDARPVHDRTSASSTQLVEDALERISTASQGFGELVADHLQLVAFMDVNADFALPYLKTYVTPLRSGKRPSGHMIACQLVWAATVIRLSRDRLQFGRDADDKEIIGAAERAQLRFIQQFPNWEEWAESLHLSGYQ